MKTLMLIITLLYLSVCIKLVQDLNTVKPNALKYMNTVK